MKKKHISFQLLKKEEALTVTVADFVEACRVTVKLLAYRRTELRDSLALFKGGMDVSYHMAVVKEICVCARHKHVVSADTHCLTALSHMSYTTNDKKMHFNEISCYYSNKI